MNELIACCGLDCEKCDARIATVTNDEALREKTAALWSQLNGVEITPELLQSKGICLLLSDLDFTLAPKSTPRPDAAVRQWIDGLRSAGIRVMILSNNRRPQRVETFCRDLGITYDDDVLRLIDIFRGMGFYVGGVPPSNSVIFLYKGSQIAR